MASQLTRPTAWNPQNSPRSAWYEREARRRRAKRQPDQTRSGAQDEAGTTEPRDFSDKNREQKYGARWNGGGGSLAHRRRPIRRRSFPASSPVDRRRPREAGEGDGVGFGACSIALDGRRGKVVPRRSEASPDVAFAYSFGPESPTASATERNLFLGRLRTVGFGINGSCGGRHEKQRSG